MLPPGARAPPAAPARFGRPVRPPMRPSLTPPFRIPMRRTAHSRPARPLLVPVLALGLLTAATASAQQELPSDVVRAQGMLDEGQVGQVRDYIDRGMAGLLSAEGVEGAADARTRLTQPLSAIGATPGFVQQYGRELASQVARVPADAEPAKKVNALLLLRIAPVQEAVPAVRPSLASDITAVRFTAAKVILDLLRRPQGDSPALPDAARRQLLSSLAEAAATEPDAFVVGKLLPAMQTLAGDGGRALLIETLNRRVVVHAANPGTGYLPELAAMSGLFLRNLGNFQRTEAAGLCAASARYLKLVSEQLAQSVIPADEVATARQMLSQSDNILRELATSQLGVPAGAAPGRIAPALDSGDFAAISAAAGVWLEALAGPGTGLDAEALSVPEIAGSPAPAAEAEAQSDPPG